MNYQKIYSDLISKFKENPSEGFSERHHIFPKCMGGTNKAENIVRLPPRHHFIAHLLLAKIYGERMLYAAWRMKTSKKYTSKEYAWLRQKISKRMKDNNPGNRRRTRAGKNNPMYGKTGTASPHFGKKYSEEHREKISIGQRGKKLSPETKAKISRARKGQKDSPETKLKKSQSHKRRAFC